MRRLTLVGGAQVSWIERNCWHSWIDRPPGALAAQADTEDRRFQHVKARDLTHYPSELCIIMHRSVMLCSVMS